MSTSVLSFLPIYFGYSAPAEAPPAQSVFQPVLLLDKDVGSCKDQLPMAR